MIMINVALAVVAVVVLLMVGACIGLMIMALVAARRYTELQGKVSKYAKQADEWHELWRKVNNHYQSYKDVARQLQVRTRGDGGRFKYVDAHTAVVEQMKENGNG